MLSLRRQLPAYSPIRFGSLPAGLGGALQLGRPRERLASRLREFYGTPDLLLTDSGTSALRLAIEGALAVRGGGAVALPAYSCYDVATAAVGAGADVRLYDLDPDTLGPDWPSLEQALAPRTAAVVAVHLYGLPVDMERLTGMAASHGAVLVEDAAQGFGGSIDGRPLGAIGSLGVLSFGRGKGITGGGGGALLANDEAGRAALEAVRARPARGRAGWNELLGLAAQWSLGRPSVYGLPASIPWLGLGETRYKKPWPPRDISRAAAAAVLANWEVSRREAETRRENAHRLRSRDFGGFPGSIAPGASPLRLPVRRPVGPERGAPGRVERSGLVPGYPATLGTVLEEVGWPCKAPSAPGAELLARDLLTAPVHSRSSPTETARLLAE